MLVLFPRFDKLLTTKNTNATFFSSRRKYLPILFNQGREGSRTVNPQTSGSTVNLSKSWPNRIIQKVLVYVNNGHI